MKAHIDITLKAEPVEESQRVLKDILERLVTDEIIEGYSFEIETDTGVVTEKCIMSEGRVIA